MTAFGINDFHCLHFCWGWRLVSVSDSRNRFSIDLHKAICPCFSQTIMNGGVPNEDGFSR